MTTYNSYQEAKIANPEYAIFEYQRNFGTDKEILDQFDIQSREMKECNPSKHCMAVEKFLADGHKFVEGDVVLTYASNDACTIDGKDLGDWNSSDAYDSQRYILRAAALETKEPKRTKESTAIDTLERLGYEWKGGELWKPPIGEVPSYLLPKRVNESYEKVEFIKLSDAAIAVDVGGIQFNKFGNQPIDDRALALHYYNNGTLSFYRRIETPIEWWEDAAEFIKPLGHSEIVNGQLLVEAAMTRDQWCDFARILLEQGE